MEHRPSILVVDDDAAFRRRLARAFEARGYEVFTASNYDEAVAIAARLAPANAVIDLKMPGRSGLDLVPALGQLAPGCKIVILTGHARIATAIEAIRLGAHHYLRKPADADQIIEAFALEPRRGQVVDERLLLGGIAARLSPDDLRGTLEPAIDALREACGADDSEIFLVEPESDALVMAACCGVDRGALQEQQRFAPGVGFPGIAASSRQPLATRDLAQEARFVRRGLVAKGVQSYACVPMPGPHGLALGTVGLAWRRRCDEHAIELLQQAAVTLAATIRAGLAAAREAAAMVVGGGVAPTARQRRSFLDLVLRATGALDATVIVPSGSSAATTTVTSTLPRGERHRRIELVDGQLACPILAAGELALHGTDRERWPEVCRCSLPATSASPCCVPLTANGQLRGALILDYGDAPPSPGTRDRVPLLTMAKGAGTLVPPNLNSRSRAPTDAGPSLPVLGIRCFGAFEVCIDGEAIEAERIPRKKAVTLLKLLLLQVGSPLSRDVLIEHLWPGASDKAGANRLHGVVHALRSVIEPMHAEKRWLYVRNQGELYYFNTESAHSVDLYTFRELCSAGRRNRQRGRLDEAIDSLDRALSLYRGDLFEDDPFADWCQTQRDDVRRSFLDAAKQAAELCVLSGAHERALGYVRRGLLVDPLREDLHQMQIRALIDMGRRAEAVDRYHACVRLLRDELGARPLPETRRLERLLHGSLQL